MTVSSADIAASIAATAEDIQRAMETYQRCPRGGKVRADLRFAVYELHGRMRHQLVLLMRKDEEDRRIGWEVAHGPPAISET